MSVRASRFVSNPSQVHEVQRVVSGSFHATVPDWIQSLGWRIRTKIGRLAASTEPTDCRDGTDESAPAHRERMFSQREMTLRVPCVSCWKRLLMQPAIALGSALPTRNVQMYYGSISTGRACPLEKPSTQRGHSPRAASTAHPLDLERPWRDRLGWLCQDAPISGAVGSKNTTSTTTITFVAFTVDLECRRTQRGQHTLPTFRSNCMADGTPVCDRVNVEVEAERRWNDDR